MSVIVESGEAELAMGDLRDEMGKAAEQPRTPVHVRRRRGRLHERHARDDADRATSRRGPNSATTPRVGRAPTDCIAVDGPYDDIRDVEGYRERMTENQAKGMTGIWSLTPGQVVEANTAPLPPEDG